MTRQLSISEKSGFKITAPDVPVIIRDCRGLLFYTTEAQTPRVKEFNLPGGKYFVDSGFFVKMREPVPYPLKALPPAERQGFPNPSKFTIAWGDNPNKCSIIWNKRTILFDRSLEDYRLPELFLILYHEYSHAQYKTEKYCDLKAYNYMIRKGFNPTQIGMSLIDSLSPQQWKRKEFLTNVITSSKFDRRNEA